MMGKCDEPSAPGVRINWPAAPPCDGIGKGYASPRIDHGACIAFIGSLKVSRGVYPSQLRLDLMQLAHVGRSSPHLILRRRHAGGFVSITDNNQGGKHFDLLRHPVLVRLRALRLGCAFSPPGGDERSGGSFSSSGFPDSARNVTLSLASVIFGVLVNFQAQAGCGTTGTGETKSKAPNILCSSEVDEAWCGKPCVSRSVASFSPTGRMGRHTCAGDNSRKAKARNLIEICQCGFGFSKSQEYFSIFEMASVNDFRSS